MLTNKVIHSGLFLMLIVILSSGLTMLRNINYSIDPSSKLSLEGTSNVTDFSCDCKQSFPGDEVYFEEDLENGTLTFQGAQLNVKTKNLDCGNHGMNKDMYNTLMADKYPYISIQLLSATLPKTTSLQDSRYWTSLNTRVALTIAGHKKVMPLVVEAKKLSDGKYHFKACQMIRMTDFGIDPPKPFFGMIKVSDEITINMNLIIQKKNESN
ncbi:MAG: YceI family protein [Saprospiraceae bacterium]|nr:YceI family protein [Saprospiraceae bacterium]